MQTINIEKNDAGQRADKFLTKYFNNICDEGGKAGGFTALIASTRRARRWTHCFIQKAA